MDYRFNKAEINDFINKVFNKFNGKINCVNKAILIIDWLQHNEHNNGAITRNPNVVTIYPLVIARNSISVETLKYQILICVIHELYHCDQDIDYIRSLTDKEYINGIESAVEFESNMFIAYNRNWLSKEFDIQIINDIKATYGIIDQFRLDIGYGYHRKTYLTHIVSILQDMIHKSDDQVIRKFIEVYNNPESCIEFHVYNDINFMLKCKTSVLPMSELNAVLYNSFFRYTHRGANIQMTSSNGIDWVVDIRISGYNRLYRLIDK